MFSRSGNSYLSKMVDKPYSKIAIQECGEPLVPIPGNVFAFFEPHPYMALGAPYGGETPWKLRVGALAALEVAQNRLQELKPGWKIKILDAYRPVQAQAFMFKRELVLLAEKEGLDPAKLSKTNCRRLLPQVHRLWARPNKNPLKPPPHSTGGVVDCTLIDENGVEVNMGSKLDENSVRSNPDYFKNAADEAGKAAHANRELLNAVMEAGGFCRNPTEWWHFSIGDQMAVLVQPARYPKGAAIYGRADLLNA